MAQVFGFLSCGRQGPVYPTQSILWLLMAWRRKEPGHQQPWCWASFPVSAPEGLKFLNENVQIFHFTFYRKYSVLYLHWTIFYFVLFNSVYFAQPWWKGLPGLCLIFCGFEIDFGNKIYSMLKYRVYCSLGYNILTHWDLVMPTYASVIIGSGNNLSTVWYQTFIWTNAEHTFEKVVCKMSAILFRPWCVSYVFF